MKVRKIEVTLGELAYCLNKTPRRIQQLVKEGVVLRTRAGRYDLIESVRGFTKHYESRYFGSADVEFELRGLKL